MTSSRWWRVRTEATSSGFAWDVRSLRFYGHHRNDHHHPPDKEEGEESSPHSSRESSKCHSVELASASSLGGNGEGREPALLVPVRATSSGSAGDGFGPANAVLFVGDGRGQCRGRGLGRIWGGRRERPGADATGGERCRGHGRCHEVGDFWIGAEFDREVSVDLVRLVEPSFNHSASNRYRIYLECLLPGGRERERSANDTRENSDSAGGERMSWVTVRKLDRANEVDRPFEGSDVFQDESTGDEVSGDRGPIPSDEELVVPPSRPLRGPVCGVSYRARLHRRNPDGHDDDPPFSPDPDLYHSECCEGLWVCVTRSCGVETLVGACSFVRAHIPPERRALWGRFISPRWCKDVGPMRLVVLDGRVDEQPGTAIPELGDPNATGRGLTTCPFVITSREDLVDGNGSITAHELVHGADMVIRQLYDPSFHEEVEDLYVRHRGLMTYSVPTPDGYERPVTRHEYGATNRDEFLAEAYMILLGMKEGSEGYRRCGLSTREDLEVKCPDVVSLLLRHFCAPSLAPT